MWWCWKERRARGCERIPPLAPHFAIEVDDDDDEVEEREEKKEKKEWT